MTKQTIAAEQPHDELTGKAAAVAIGKALQQVLAGTDDKVHITGLETIRQPDGRLLMKLGFLYHGTPNDVTFSVDGVWARILRDRLTRLYPL